MSGTEALNFPKPAYPPLADTTPRRNTLSQRLSKMMPTWHPSQTGGEVSGVGLLHLTRALEKADKKVNNVAQRTLDPAGVIESFEATGEKVKRVRNGAILEGTMHPIAYISKEGIEIHGLSDQDTTPELQSPFQEGLTPENAREVMTAMTQAIGNKHVTWTALTDVHLFASNQGHCRTILSEPERTQQLTEDGVATVSGRLLSDIPQGSYTLSASPEVWKILSSDQAGTLLQDGARRGLAEPEIAAEIVKIVHMESRKEQKRVDDITIIVHCVKHPHYTNFVALFDQLVDQLVDQLELKVKSTPHSATIQNTKSVGRHMINYNEDRSYVFNRADGIMIHGVADGHGGIHASEYVANHLDTALNTKDLTPKNANKVMQSTVETLEKGYLLAKSQGKFSNQHLFANIAGHETREAFAGTLPEAGTTASWTVQTATHLFAVNLGDSRTILSEPSKTTQLTRDDSLSDENVLQEAKDQGLNITSGFHGKHVLGKHACPMISQIGYEDVPTIARTTSLEIKKIEKGSYAISATDAAWDVFSSAHIGALVQQMAQKKLSEEEIVINLSKVVHIEYVNQFKNLNPTYIHRAPIDDITIVIHKVR